MSVFLSTLSLRRATPWHGVVITSLHHFYPRSPCGERPLVHQLRGLADVSISIHALLAESDHNTRNNCIGYCDFYPRSPCGERPFLPHMPMAAFCHFYPRSPCGERLVPACCSSRWRNYFYPRSPCGERRRQVSRLIIGYTFLSTLSLRRATTAFSMYGALPAFLSTLSLRRATSAYVRVTQRQRDFYPRSPCGERPTAFSMYGALPAFLSTLSLRRATYDRPPLLT